MTPTPTIVLRPASLNFNAIGYQQTFAPSEVGFGGTFSATSADCGGVATFSATTSGSPPAFIVTSSAAGVCHIVVSDGNGGSATETVTITTTGGSISLTNRTFEEHS